MHMQNAQDRLPPIKETRQSRFRESSVPILVRDLPGPLAYLSQISGNFRTSPTVKLKEGAREKDTHIMAAEVKHFAVQIPKLNLVLKTNLCSFGECERNASWREVLT